MNKKLFLGMFAAAGMLLATSCSNDELDVVQSGNEAQVTFSLAAEGGIATRAISDGKTANKLVYAVFDSEGNPLSVFDVNNDGTYEHQKTETISDIVTAPHEVTITLAKGQTYQVAFWAQNESCTAYKTSDLRNIEVLYGGLNNDETRDAFFKTETITVKGNEERKIELRRPFAQINVGVTEADWNAAVASGVTISESKVVIKNAAKYIDLLTGEVNGEVEVEYGFSAIPTDPAILEVDVNRDGAIQDDEKYKYLSMSYILTSAERTTLESDGLQFTFKSGGEPIVFDEGLHQVPVQRNWRTNILGKLLTGDITFEVVIVPDYEDDYNLWYPENDDNSVISVTTAEEITNAIKNATSDVTINFANDITGNVIAEQKANVNVVINGNGYKYSEGTIDIYGHARHTGPETLTFTNIVFEHTSDGALDFISCNTTDSEKRYAHNVAVVNCTFIGNGKFDDSNAVVAARYRQCYNMSFENCTATGLHSLIWATGTNGVSLDKVTIKDSKSGVSFGTSTNISVENSNFNVTEDYGIRADGTVATTLTVKNTTIDAATPIVIRKTTAAYNVALEGDVKLNTPSVYHVVFTNGNDDADYVTPTGAYNITGTEGFNVYPDDASATSLNASSDAQISSIIDAGVNTINLTPGTYIIPDDAKGKTLTFIGTGNPEDTKIATQDDGSYEGCDYSLDGATVTFENITINTNSQTYTGYARCKGTYKNCVINGTFTLYDNSTFEECTFNVSGDVYNIWTWGAPVAKFNKCTFNSDGKAMLLYGTANTELTIENSVFNDKGGLTDLKAAIEIGNDYNKSYTLVVNNTIVNGYEINDKGINTGTTLWANKNSMGTDKLSVTVDGVKVY